MASRDRKIPTMGKRYYCDFCDKAFADSGLNRKNHFKGATHKRLRKQHYDAFRDASTILAEEAAKLPCNRFLQTGHCDYQDSCKFSHMIPERRRHLETQIAHDNDQKRKKAEESMTTPSIEEWLAKRKKKKEISTGEATSNTDTTYELPPFLACVPNLPPSLLPPSPENLNDVSDCDWG